MGGGGASSRQTRPGMTLPGAPPLAAGQAWEGDKVSAGENGVPAEAGSMNDIMNSFAASRSGASGRTSARGYD